MMTTIPVPDHPHENSNQRWSLLLKHNCSCTAKDITIFLLTVQPPPSVSMSHQTSTGIKASGEMSGYT